MIQYILNAIFSRCALRIQIKIVLNAGKCFYIPYIYYTRMQSIWMYVLPDRQEISLLVMGTAEMILLCCLDELTLPNNCYIY